MGSPARFRQDARRALSGAGAGFPTLRGVLWYENGMHLKRHHLIAGLDDLGAAAVESGKIIDLAVYGGSCLILVSNFRDASQDVDAVAMTDQVFVDTIANQIAEKRGWPRDWLNDGVRVYLSPNVDMPDDHYLFGSYPSEQNPGLRVYVPTPEYMLAMKLMSLRIDDAQGEKDKSDIENLMTIVGIKDKTALLALASSYYPEARVSAKLVLAADGLLAEALTKDAGHVAPRYLDRRGDGGTDR